MSREYMVPKREVRARILLPGQGPEDVKLFLGERAETHDGPEQPSDLFNGSLAFVPAMSHSGRVMLIHRDALLAVSVDALDEKGVLDLELVPDDVTRASVQIVLEDGTSIVGTVSYLMPDSQRRLQDFLNGGARFLTVEQDRTVHLVNKGRIVKILSG